MLGGCVLDGNQQKTGNIPAVLQPVLAIVSELCTFLMQISVLKHILRTHHQWLKRIQLFPTYEMQGMPKKNDMIVCSTDESAELSEKTKMVVMCPQLLISFTQLATVWLNVTMWSNMVVTASVHTHL